VTYFLVTTGVLLTGALVWVIHWFRGTARAELNLKNTTAELETARAHRAAQEAAAAKERAERKKDFDEKATAVSTAGDAGTLLRETLGKYNAS
jgi:hypothetical protein